ncbi:uncharacterized protein LOC110829903 [Zootermopsis nevadensis]|uniref:uncharacterized protein LOC110829903 n=1 Tax=Zootermopsis nevadensis TaxID=136037 RepID=UPI000B8ECF8F|nr:uncharacterized protein LOC110829903 [Zootermopsis nevadensis]
MTLNCVHRPSGPLLPRANSLFGGWMSWWRSRAPSCPWSEKSPLKADEPGWVNGIGCGRQGESTALKILRISQVSAAQELLPTNPRIDYNRRRSLLTRVSEVLAASVITALKARRKSSSNGSLLETDRTSSEIVKFDLRSVHEQLYFLQTFSLTVTGSRP